MTEKLHDHELLIEHANDEGGKKHGINKNFKDEEKTQDGDD